MRGNKHPDFREGVPFLGGSLWIDLLNTVLVVDDVAVDLVGDAERLQRWSRLAGLVAAESPGDAEVRRIAELRDRLREGFEALAAGEPVPGRTVGLVNALLDRVTIRLRLETGPGGLSLNAREGVSGDPIAAAAALDFARSAADVDPARLKHCANPVCVMVFRDEGKNNRRRWCSMAACGNRDKVAKYRARKRSEA